ncbi:hypothetical protein M0804_003370 [Polistes exclamans]|nr:hypothetical protein M0804_003370 [Polistes exclamans]
MKVEVVEVEEVEEGLGKGEKKESSSVRIKADALRENTWDFLRLRFVYRLLYYHYHQIFSNHFWNNNNNNSNTTTSSSSSNSSSSCSSL